MTGKYDRKKVENEFDSISKNSPIVHWDPDRGDIITTVGKKAIELLELKKDNVLLDMGTGRGRWAMEASPLCKRVIGIDISSNLLESARKLTEEKNISNITYFKGSFENPFEETDLEKFEINKLIAIYAMHHLTDDLKKVAVKNMLDLLKRPATIVIGDLIWSEPPEKYKDRWEEVYYDEGESDFPASSEYLTSLFKEEGAVVEFIKIHPLVGLIKASIK